MSSLPITPVHKDSSPHNTPLGVDSTSFWASILAMIVGFTTIVLAIWIASDGSTPLPLAIGMATVGIVECVVAFYTWKRVRAAWAFALSLNGACFFTLFFSGPRIRDAMGWAANSSENVDGIIITSVNYGALLLALGPCAFFGAIVFLYSLSPEDF